MTKSSLLSVAGFGVVLVTLLWSVQIVASIGTYTVIAPKILRPGLNYKVSVSIHDTRDAVRVTVAINGVGLRGVTYGQSTEAIVNSGETQILQFEVGEWGPGSYNLTVSGSGGLHFVNSTAIEFQHKSYSVFIQTDKAIYQPGQTVHFRAIVVTPMLKPTVAGAISAFVTDGQDNRIKQWKRVFTSKGVFSSDLTLSDQPVLGNWNITVVVSDQQYTKSFTVAEYVLPTYEVTVQLPPYATINDTEVIATVTAKYTYGKPVKGDVTLVMSPQVNLPLIQVWLIPPVRKTTTIDGIADIPLDLKDLKLQDEYQREIRVEAIVKESLTGQRQNASSILSLFRHRIKLELIKTAETFKPGLKFTAYLKVAYQDDVPVRDNTYPVRVQYGYNYNKSTHLTRKFQVPPSGIVQLDFYPPHSPDANVLVVEAKYLDVEQHFPGIEQALSPSRNYVQAVVLSDNPKVTDEVEVQVNATEPLTTIVFQILGRGNLALAQTVHVNNNAQSLRFKFLVTPQMAPNARLIVYYVRADGEVVADAVNFDVDGVFQTPVSVGVSVNQTLPGSQVEVRVNTKPNAYVGILGIDQKVLLLKSGNDITQQDVLNELATYDSGVNRVPYGDLFFRYLWSPGTTTTSQVFEDSGVVIITNGNVFQYYPRSEGDGGEDQTGRRVPSKSGDGNGVRRPEHDKSGRLSEHPGTQQRRNFIPDYSLPITGTPNSWLWSDMISGDDGSASVASAAPDTITSWMVSAFAIDPMSGLGVVPAPTKLTVFRPFFVSLNLPYSIIRGEAVAVQVVVFNYMQKDTEATVTLRNSGQFDFGSFESGANEVVPPSSSSSDQKQRRVMVKSGDGASVSFMIVPKILGFVDIEVSAQSSTAGDRILKKLLVKPEGTTLYFNRAVLVDLRTNPTFSATVKVDIPAYAVPGSSNVEVSAIGDILGTAINNLDGLLQMPFGCGEQNMVYFVPNIVVGRYLEKVGRLRDSLRHKIVTHLETGYQRQLTYKRGDGSFSAFGKQDKMGSTWLTAFVAKSFHQARQYVTIDDGVVNGALRWLASQQATDGSFPEVGYVSHKAMQGGSANGIALTAYVLTAFLETESHRKEEFAGVVDKARKRLEQAVTAAAAADETYALAIAAYTLQLLGSLEAEATFKKLTKNAKTSGDAQFWTDTSEADMAALNRTGHQTKSYDVEMTSYALMTYVLRNDIENAVRIMRWLVTQTNANGGFASTQDTVVGIRALATLAEQISGTAQTGDGRGAADITFTFRNATKTIPINFENAMILHKLQLFDDVRQVDIQAKGSGFAVVQVSYFYNVNVTKELPSFRINPLVDRNSNRNLLVINACTSYTKQGTSNMAVMEINLPSGYTVDKDSLPALLRVTDVKRVESKDGDSKVVIYFDSLGGTDVCPTVKAYRTYRVAKQKPTAVRVYDYYDLSRSARSFYQAVPATLCDICDDGECDSQCPKDDSADLRGLPDAAPPLPVVGITLLLVSLILSWVLRPC